MERKGIDKAGKDYWDKCWEASDISGIIDPRKNNIGGVIDRAIDKFLRKFLRGGVRQIAARGRMWEFCIFTLFKEGVWI